MVPLLSQYRRGVATLPGTVGVRCWERHLLGEASDPSVMTMPELAPLPIPMARATMPIVVAVWASGKVRSARAWMKIDGTATHQRPNLSMRAPPGRKSRTSAAIDQA